MTQKEAFTDTTKTTEVVLRYWLVTAKSLLVAICVLCAGCGTFPLARDIRSPPDRTAEQRDIAILACKDRARLAAGSADHQATAFLLGLTIVGTPLAYEIDKQTQRSVFARCMTERGYVVIPNDSAEGES